MEKILEKTNVKMVGLVLLAYLLAYQGSYVPLLLLLGVALLVERDSVLNWQIGQVVVLRVLYDAILAAWNVIYRVLSDLFEMFDASHDTVSSLRDFNDTFGTIAWYAFIALLIIGLIKVLSCKKAKIPVVSGITRKLFE